MLQERRGRLGRLLDDRPLHAPSCWYLHAYSLALARSHAFVVPVYVGALRLRGGCQPPVYLVKGLSPPVNVRPTRLLISQHRHAGATPDHRPAAMWEPGVEHVAGGFARIAFYEIRMRCRCVWASQELYFLIRFCCDATSPPTNDRKRSGLPRLLWPAN